MLVPKEPCYRPPSLVSHVSSSSLVQEHGGGVPATLVPPSPIIHVLVFCSHTTAQSLVILAPGAYFPHHLESCHYLWCLPSPAQWALEQLGPHPLSLDSFSSTPLSHSHSRLTLVVRTKLPVEPSLPPSLLARFFHSCSSLTSWKSLASDLSSFHSLTLFFSLFPVGSMVCSFSNTLDKLVIISASL